MAVEVPEKQTVQRWVQIIDVTRGNRIMTAIEILSPGNKAAGRLRRMYRRKLADYRRRSVSGVEIDLLRWPGRRHLAVETEALPQPRQTPYLVLVRRAWAANVWRCWPVPLRERVPAFHVPLRREDAEIVLDLQPLLDRVYIAGGHDNIDFSKPPVPPPGPGDWAWAGGLASTRATRQVVNEG